MHWSARWRWAAQLPQVPTNEQADYLRQAGFCAIHLDTRGYYEEANRKQGKTGENLLRILETRLDNVVYRAGFAKSRDMARQFVRHGHIMVNGKKVDIPSFRVSENDIVEVAPSSREMTPFIVARAEAGERPVPTWIEVIPNRMRVLVHALPSRALIDTQVQEQLIVELYSK